MWGVRFDSSLDSWAVVPAPDEHQRRPEWAKVVADAVKAQWSIDDGDGFSQALDRVLETLQHSRADGTLADLVAWPSNSPLPLRVSFILAVGSETLDWSSLGFEASPYLEGPFGEGIQHSRRIPPEGAQGIESIDAVIVFDRGDQALLVHVHACPVDVYVMSVGAIAELIESCVLTDSTGRLFTTGKSEYRSDMNSDVWPDLGRGISA